MVFIEKPVPAYPPLSMFTKRVFTANSRVGKDCFDGKKLFKKFVNGFFMPGYGSFNITKDCVSIYMIQSIPEIRHYGYRRVHTRNLEFHRPYPKKRCAVTVAVVTRIDARQYPKSSKVWKYNMHHVQGDLGSPRPPLT